jgi:hypothetical protein
MIGKRRSFLHVVGYCQTLKEVGSSRTRSLPLPKEKIAPSGRHQAAAIGQKQTDLFKKLPPFRGRYDKELPAQVGRKTRGLPDTHNINVGR